LDYPGGRDGDLIALSRQKIKFSPRSSFDAFLWRQTGRIDAVGLFARQAILIGDGQTPNRLPGFRIRQQADNVGEARTLFAGLEYASPTPSRSRKRVAPGAKVRQSEDGARRVSHGRRRRPPKVIHHRLKGKSH
jgi:hypothetical protein